MRRLTQTVLAGGVVYPVGTAEKDIPVKVTLDGVWDTQAAEDPDDEPGSGYEALTKAELVAEIEKRNADRDPAGEAYLSVTGNKPDLIAALEADDQAQG